MDGPFQIPNHPTYIATPPAINGHSRNVPPLTSSSHIRLPPSVIDHHRYDHFAERSDHASPPQKFSVEQDVTEKPRATAAQENGYRGDARRWASLMYQAGFQSLAAASQGRAEQEHDTSRTSLGPFSWLYNAAKSPFLPRWFAFVFLITALLWAPGIVALTAYNARPANDFAQPTVWNTGIFWWSSWLSSIWVGWWGCRAASGFLPRLFKKFIGPVGTGSHIGIRRIPDYLIACEKYLAVVFQSVLVYTLWLTLIWGHYASPSRSSADSAVNPLGSTLTNSTLTYIESYDSSSDTDATTELLVTISRFFFGGMLCAILLLLEKLIIQVIAFSFHKITYSQRLALCQFQVAVLATLWKHARLVNRRGSMSTSHTPLPPPPEQQNRSRWGSGRRERQRNGHTLLGTTAGGLIADQYSTGGEDLEYVILNAFETPGDTKRLARRIFYSLCRRDLTDASAPCVLSVQDFAPFFPDTATACAAFEAIDGDSNGTITLEEMVTSCLEMRYGRFTLIDSMHDVDSAVNSLDHGFMSIYTLVAAILIAAMLSTTFANLVTSLSAVVLGLSWLFAASASEALGAILLLIVKHPYDTGDCVDISDVCGANLVSYTVAEMFLLSTTFKDAQGRHVQIANAQLAQKAIINHRRSGPCIEPFTIDLHYTTSLSQLETLRENMIGWLDTQGRDFLPGLDLAIASLDSQTKMTICAGIKYKGNWQDPGLKARRRNRWICAFKSFLAQLKIFGPVGDPAVGPVTKVAMIDVQGSREGQNSNSPRDTDQTNENDDEDNGDPASFNLMDEPRAAPAVGSGASTPRGEGVSGDRRDPLGSLDVSSSSMRRRAGSQSRHRQDYDRVGEIHSALEMGRLR